MSSNPCSLRLRILTALSVGGALAATWYWLDCALNRDGWGLFWFIFLVAPTITLLSAFGGLLPNLEAYRKTRTRGLKWQVTACGCAGSLVLVEALLAFVLPKSSC